MSAMRFTLPEETVFLQPLQENPPCGISLRYDPIYDQIRDARREDDDRLSQGVWVTPHKKADWSLVEQLCCDALLTRSKDLQLTAWLTEAWEALDGLAGLIRGIRLLDAFCSTFWDSLYPQMTEGDIEYRLHIFEWLRDTLVTRLANFKITDPEHASLTYADWLTASRLDNTAKKSTDPAQFMKKAEAASQLTLSDFNNQFAHTDTEYVVEAVSQIGEAFEVLGELKKTLDEKCGKDGPSFSQLEALLRGLKNLMENQSTFLPESRSLPQMAFPEQGEGGDSVPISQELAEPTTRAQAYHQLSVIADCLQKLEPHSPAPHLLRRIVTWENKNLTEILSTFSPSSQDFSALIRLLGPYEGS